MTNPNNQELVFNKYEKHTIALPKDAYVEFDSNDTPNKVGVAWLDFDKKIIYCGFYFNPTLIYPNYWGQNNKEVDNIKFQLVEKAIEHAKTTSNYDCGDNDSHKKWVKKFLTNVRSKYPMIGMNKWGLSGYNTTKDVNDDKDICITITGKDINITTGGN